MSKLTNAKYLSLIDASSGYSNLRLNEQSLYLTTFACQFGRWRDIWLPFLAALAGKMLQRKIDEIFKESPNVFGTDDNILIVGYYDNGRDHDNTLWRVLLICRKVSLKLQKDSCHLGAQQSHFWQDFQTWYETWSKKTKKSDMLSKYKRRNCKHSLEYLIPWVSSLLAK